MTSKTHTPKIIFLALAILALFFHTHFTDAITTKEATVVPQGLVGYWNFDVVK